MQPITSTYRNKKDVIHACMPASRQGKATSVTFTTFDWQDTLSFLGVIAAFFLSIQSILHHWKSSKQNYFYDKSN